MARLRVPEAKVGELKACYGKVDGDKDIYYCHGGGGAVGADSRMLANFIEGVEYNGKTLKAELEARGYDTTTLKFSIQQQPPTKEVQHA